MPPLFAPLLSGLLSAGAVWHWAIYPVFSDTSSAMAFGGTVASISTTMLGFMLAALAVLASINQTHLVKMMREHGHYHDLLVTMMIGCLLFLSCACFGFAMLFGIAASPTALTTIVSLHVSALVSLIDVGRKLWLVLSNLRSE